MFLNLCIHQVFLLDGEIDLAKNSPTLTKYLLNLSATSSPSSMTALSCLNLMLFVRYLRLSIIPLMICQDFVTFVSCLLIGLGSIYIFHFDRFLHSICMPWFVVMVWVIHFSIWKTFIVFLRYNLMKFTVGWLCT